MYPGLSTLISTMFWKNKTGRNKISMQYFSEEVLNVITHLSTLIVFTFLSGILLSHTPTFIQDLLYCLCTINLYVASMLYHYFEKVKLKKILRIFDHSSINLLIAGSYTPFMIHIDSMVMLTVVWTIALLNILEMIYYQVVSDLNLAKYLIMGWMILLNVNVLYREIPESSFYCLLLGGLSYTVGTYFFINDSKRKFYHTVWHIFTSAGTLFHFFAVYYLNA
jgi:hemolysin III